MCIMGMESALLNVQTQAYQPAQSAAIQEPGHHCMHAGQVSDDRAHHIPGEDRRHAFVRAGTDGVHRAAFGVQHLLREKKPGGQGLVVRGRSDMFISGQMGQKGLHRSDAHRRGAVRCGTG